MSSDWLPFSWSFSEHLQERETLLRRYTVFLPPVLILFGELSFYFDYPRYTLWGYLITIFVCVFASLRLTEDIPAFRAFVLVSVFRLITLGMPVFFESTIYRLPLVYGPLFPAIYLVGRTRSPALSIGWKPAVLVLPVALPLSVLLAEIEYRLLRPEALISGWSGAQLVLIGIVMIGVVGLAEELLFRGILQRALQNRLGRWSGLVVASVLFGSMYSGYGVPAEPIYAAGMGLLFGLIYDWTDSLALVAVIHGLLNVFLFAVIPFQGSIIVL